MGRRLRRERLLDRSGHVGTEVVSGTTLELYDEDDGESGSREIEDGEEIRIVRDDPGSDRAVAIGKTEADF